MNPKIPKMYWQNIMENSLEEYPECPSCNSEWSLNVSKISCSKCNLKIDCGGRYPYITNNLFDKNRIFTFKWVSNTVDCKSLGTCTYEEFEFVDISNLEHYPFIHARYVLSDNPIIKDGGSFRPNITLERLQSLIVFS